jgi:hypothetical protein
LIYCNFIIGGWQVWLAMHICGCMSSHKNQHFLPRCHLKPFTAGGGGFAINVYNIERGRGIRNAPVKGQCSRNYFYGEDLRLEKWLQRIEAEYGRLIGKISEPRYKLDEPGRFLLRRFMLLQYSRTETAARRRATGTEDIHDAVFSNRKNPEEIDLSIRSIAQDCMKTFGAIMHLVDDLKICLIRNDTRRSFVTSDDPGILTNRWHIQKAQSDVFGLGSAGALLILRLRHGSSLCATTAMCTRSKTAVVGRRSQGSTTWSR